MGSPGHVRSGPAVLWVSVETPDSAGGGGQRRQFHQLRALLAAGIDVHVATLAGPQSAANVSRLAPTVRFAHRRRRLRRTKTFEQIVASIRPRRAIVAHVESVPYVAPALTDAGIPFLVDFHNVVSRYHALLGEAETEREWAARETDALASATQSTACSAEEAAALRALLPSAQIAVAPHGVAPEEWPDDAVAPTTDCTVALFGSWSHRPNAEAAAWFAAEVWPAVRAAVPEARFLLLGPGDPQIDARAPGIEIHGRVDDLAAVLGRTRVCVVPIRRGIGTRVKFVESLASGAAVVATTAGAEGFHANGAFVLADEPGSFTAACSELLRDASAARALGSRGRAVALERYSWSRVSQPLVDFARG